MTIAIGNDHAGITLKFEIIDYLQSKKISVMNLGTDEDISVDYPDYASKVATHVLNKKVDLGILICGTGIGMSIAANKFKGIRAANIYDEQTARLAKEHNFANVITFGARTHTKLQVFRLIDVFLDTKFEERHQQRIDKIKEIEG